VTPRRLRSILFVPAVRPDRFEKALSSGADAVVFDLEDSVEASRKSEARRIVGDALSANPVADGPARFVRVNQHGSEWLAEDLDLIDDLASIDGIVVPKVQSAGAITDIATAVLSRSVVPILETSAGVLNALAIAQSVPGIPALLFGAEDLTAEIGIPRTLDGEEILFARSQVVLAAAAAGIDAIDAVWIGLDSPDALRRDATRARALGFTGKMAIHPDQVPIINDVFSPSPADVDRARRIIDAFEDAEARGDGVIRLDNQMIDAPIVARARRLLSRVR
jgi:citrate lyase subunit beta/citryl-CoA lyase